jgi:hypothetical protein
MYDRCILCTHKWVYERKSELWGPLQRRDRPSNFSLIAEYVIFRFCPRGVQRDVVIIVKPDNNTSRMFPKRPGNGVKHSWTTVDLVCIGYGTSVVRYSTLEEWAVPRLNKSSFISEIHVQQHDALSGHTDHHSEQVHPI